MQAAQRDCACALEEIERTQRLIAEAAGRLIDNWAALRDDLERQRAALLALLDGKGSGRPASAMASNARRLIEHHGRAIARGLDAGVVALQFQDVTRQLLETTAHRLRSMQQLLHPARRDGACTGPRERAIRRAHPVAQATLDPGSIELF